jgi:dihydropteroate synthase
VPVVLMHWDERRDRERDIFAELRRYFDRSLEIAAIAGIAADRIIADPGFGFAKSLAENYLLLRQLDRLAGMDLPLLVGTSRKSMLGRLLDVPPADRVSGTLATTTIGYWKGAHMFRVHDVAPNVQALRIAEATLYGPQEGRAAHD